MTFKKTLDNTRWGRIALGDIFPIIITGCHLILPDYRPGNIAYVSCNQDVNGIVSFVTPNNKAILHSNCLTISNSGNEYRSVHHHPHSFYANKQVTILKNPAFDKFTYFFLIPLVSRNLSRYCFSYTVSRQRHGNRLIDVPILGSGLPDYRFMSRYMRGIFADKEKVLHNTLVSNVNGY